MSKKMKLALSLAAAGLLALGSTANAQQLYIVGEVTSPEWGPGTNAFAGGTVADTEIDSVPDSLNSNTVPASVHQLTPGEIYEWKVAAQGWNPEYPGPQNMFLKAPDPAEDITFHLRLGNPGDGFIPAGNFLYTSTVESALLAAPSIQFLGSFVSELGGTDWTYDDSENPILTDAGSGQIGDGIYGASFTGMDPGTYEGLIIFDPVDLFDMKISDLGLGNGANLSFNVIDSTDTITILLEIATGRTRIENDNVAASPGPPFFAYGPATPWGTSMGTATELNDMSDGTYQRVFTVPTPGEYYVKIHQGLGDSVPNSGNGGYPFTTTVANQEVLVVFDRNTYTDDFFPAQDFVVVVDNSTRGSLNTFSRVQPVGNWQAHFGAAGDWDPQVAAMNMADQGDGIWSVTLTEQFGETENRGWKVVFSRAGNPDDDPNLDPNNAWNSQAGGFVEGLNSQEANNPDVGFSYAANQAYTFVADMITGRIGYAQGTTAPVPTRGNYLTGATSVDEWMMY